MTIKVSSKASGFTLVELLLVVAVISVLATIAIPDFLQLRAKAHNASSASAGRNAQTAMEVCYRLTENYAPNLQVLLQYEPNLTEDTGVTFLFGSINNSGYTFTTTHRRGDASFEYRD